MKAIEIKIQLHNLIDQENDIYILEAIMTLLKKSSLNPVLKEKLTIRALQSEEDIKEGRVFSRQQAEEKLNKRMGI